MTPRLELARRPARHPRRRRRQRLGLHSRAATPPATSGCNGAGRRNSRCASPTTTPGRNSDDDAGRRHLERRHDFGSLSTPATSPRKERLTNGLRGLTLNFPVTCTRSRAARRCCSASRSRSRCSPILLALFLPDIYTSSALVEIDEPSSTQSLAETSGGDQSYADQYVTNLKGIVLTDSNLRKMASEHDLYPDSADDPGAMLTRLRRDISVNIVTTPILDPRTGREREVVDAFTLSYDHREPAKAQAGAQWLVAAFLAEHRRQRQGRASNAARVLRQGSGARAHAGRGARIQARRLQARQLRVSCPSSPK